MKLNSNGILREPAKETKTKLVHSFAYIFPCFHRKRQLIIQIYEKQETLNNILARPLSI